MNMKLFLQLPVDIIDHKIKPYLALQQIYLTNKTDYISYTIEKYASLNSYETKATSKINKSYIVKIIRHDYDFIFNILLDLKFKSWYKPWKINYKGSSLPCFIELLNYMCIENKANRCREKIKDKINNKIGKRKNKHKRIRIINNTWSN